MIKDNRPYMFVTFRKHKETKIIYAVFNQTYDPVNNLIQVYFDNHHEMLSTLNIRDDTVKALHNDYQNICNELKSIYEVYIDNLSAIVKCVPYLPFKE